MNDHFNEVKYSENLEDNDLDYMSCEEEITDQEFDLTEGNIRLNR